MNKQEFDEKYWGGHLVVHCETEELANEFLGLADSFGYKWKTSGSYVNKNRYEDHGINTCYDIRLGEFCSLNHATVYDYKIIKFKTQIRRKPLLHKMIDLFMEEWGLEFNEEFFVSDAKNYKFKISKNYDVFGEYKNDGYCIYSSNVIMKQDIVKLTKKVKYTLEIEQEEISNCYQCKLLLNSYAKECFITRDAALDDEIPDNCPLKKVEA
jgi:hypothetical protein